MQNTTLLILGSVLLVSLISLVGILVFALHDQLLKRGLLYFVSFAVGALLGDVFLHMIPAIAEDRSFFPTAMLLVLGGLLLSFAIEKFIHWRHCHVLECTEHVRPMGMVNLIGDAVHNFVDGLLIAGSYLVSIPMGIATTIAVALHEIPQEMGDFAILVYSGYTKKKAMLFNLLCALTAFLGAILVLVSSNALPKIGLYLLPLTAGNFLYIAGTDLIPELHKEAKFGQAFLQLLCMIAGIALMYALTMVD